MTAPDPAGRSAPVPTSGAAPVEFVHALRRAGLPAPVDATIAFVDALRELGPDRPASVYWAGRATLVQRPEDIATYDRVFGGFFGGEQADRPGDPASEAALLVDDDPVTAPADPSPPEPHPAAGGPVVRVRWSNHEVLRAKDFASCTADELAEAHRLLRDLRLTGSTRRSRRLRPSRHRGRLDLRRTSREALRTFGEPLRTHRHGPGRRPRRLVLLCDVSGSMDPYVRAMLRFAQAVTTGRRQVEVFALGTRLTRLTRELSSHDPDAALERAAGAVPDWAGGTRLGDGLRAFNDDWGQRGTARGADVVILSDGWDRGDPAMLAEQMARLGRVARRVIWVNPLKAAPGYEPLARGMAAALPHVDAFVAGHSLGSLDDLAALLDREIRP